MTDSVLITGVKGGIGAALARAFHGAGWNVVGTDRQTAEKSAYAYIEADFTKFASDATSLSAFSERVRQACVGAPLRALINNAAVQRLGRLNKLSREAIVETYNVNIAAPMLLVKEFLPELEAGKGIVINMGSVHARSSKPEFSAYATSKAAIHGLTRALAVDLGPMVRVVTLAPAAVSTPMLQEGFEGRKEALKNLEKTHPIERIAEPDEIAKIALFLTMRDASFITGTTIYADGGILSRLHDPL